MPLTKLERATGAEMAVTLINSWDEYDREHEHLRDADVLRRWLRGNGFPRAADAGSDDDLPRARELRSRLPPAFRAAPPTPAGGGADRARGSPLLSTPHRKPTRSRR